MRSRVTYAVAALFALAVLAVTAALAARPIPPLGLRWGFVNLNGVPVIEPQFEEVRAFHEGRAVVREGDQYGYIDTTGAFAINPSFDFAGDFSEGLARVRQDGRDLFMKMDGDLAFELSVREYESVPPESTTMFRQGRVFAFDAESNSYGFKSKDGSWVSADRYLEAEPFTGEGLALVWTRNGRYGYAGRDGQLAIEDRFSAARSFNNGRAFVREDDRKGFIDVQGRLVWEVEDEDDSLIDVDDYSEELVRFESRYQFGYRDLNGHLAIEANYPAYHGDERFAAFHEGRAVVVWGDHCGYINRDGMVVIPFQYAAAYPFKQGRARAMRDGRYGFINSNGSFIVPAIYESAQDFSEGLAAVAANVEI